MKPDEELIKPHGPRAILLQQIYLTDMFWYDNVRELKEVDRPQLLEWAEVVLCPVTFIDTRSFSLSEIHMHGLVHGRV